jgi:hypothetical protein
MGQEFQMRFPAAKNFSKKNWKTFHCHKNGVGRTGYPILLPRQKNRWLSLSSFSFSLSLFLSLSHFASLFLLFKSFFGVGGVSPAQLPLSLFLSVWSARGQLFIVSTSRQPGANYIEQIVIDSLRLLNFFPSFFLFVYLIFLKFVALCELEFVFYR